MSDEAKTLPVTTEKIEGIPLYLVPTAIADQIKKKGRAVFQIRVELNFHHRYSVTVDTVDTVDEPVWRMGKEISVRKEGDGHD